MDDPDELLFHQLLRAHFNANRWMLCRQGLGDVGSPRLLHTLADCPDDPDAAPTQKELADRLRCAPATIAVSLRSLERAGYVCRRTDRRDSRRNRISLTPKGRETVERSRAAFRQVDEQMYAGFSPEERELVQRLHRRMLENLSRIGGNAGPGPHTERMDQAKC